MTALCLLPSRRVVLLSLALTLLVQQQTAALSDQQPAPVLTAAVAPSSAPVNSQVTFTANLSAPVAGPLVYRFFVDGQPVTVGWQNSPTYVYAAQMAGPHLVRVEAGRRVWSGGERLSTAISPLELDSRPASFHAEPQPGPSQRATTSQVATATSSGDTGLWSVPTSEVLRHRRWAVSFYAVNTDDGQGFTDITRLPVTVAFGLRDRAEIFGSWSLATRIDRDTRPLFFREGASQASSGTGGGLVVDYPLVRGSWTGNKLGDLVLGAKLNLVPSGSGPAAALRAQVKLPVGSESAGTSSGKTDFITDLVVSGRTRVMELAGYGGLMVRGNPSGYSLTNGLRWGVGTAFPLEGRLRASAELVRGEVLLELDHRAGRPDWA